MNKDDPLHVELAETTKEAWSHIKTSIQNCFGAIAQDRHFKKDRLNANLETRRNQSCLAKTTVKANPLFSKLGIQK